MDKLQKLLQDDLPRLGTYFLDMTAVQGDGVLLVNYYPNDAIAQMEAKFLKASVVPKYSRQMGLADLVAQFEAHDRQTQMVVAVVTPETKGTLTVEVSSTPPPAPEPETVKPETAAPTAKSTTTKSKAKGKTSTRTTSKSPAPEPEPAPEPAPEPETAKPSAKSTTKPKAQGKTSTRTTAKSPAPEPEPAPEPAPELETAPPPAKPAKPATRHKARRTPLRTAARRRKAT
ncbi:hypothetical protein H6G17_17870 [Chroococcidiopsis sp. FACHB-1243]|uniref:hypothetical protein n=1 Tax=Chroococcidiopsis sp. [FACHB-1243] TaxID=2692781 RepID=UPI00177D273D|nr:hypothetical protein [Chroococcidiopsis sp. [FACHB-1243]]MBD2307349.1 hypothetical protein [Chroococcidiopsis sp. [FACHB-1243]]